jgi:hypothetical protein
MELAKFRWRRLAEALGIGLAIEIVEGICVISLLPPQWANAIGDLPLQPASYLVTSLAKANHLGFEGQVLYFFLAVVVQWMVYSAVVYLLLAISRKKRDAT